MKKNILTAISSASLCIAFAFGGFLRFKQPLYMENNCFHCIYIYIANSRIHFSVDLAGHIPDEAAETQSPLFALTHMKPDPEPCLPMVFILDGIS